MKEVIIKLIKQNMPIQTVWAKAKSIDFDNKIMDCIGISDDLEYYDVLLGLGSINIKPKQNTKCLIGTIENEEAASFLIWAEEIDEIEIIDSSGFKCHLKKGKMTLNGDSFGGIVKAPELKTQVDKNSQILQAMLNVFQMPVNEPGNGAPSVFQATLMSATAGKQVADLSNIENDKIKHGG